MYVSGGGEVPSPPWEVFVIQAVAEKKWEPAVLHGMWRSWLMPVKIFNLRITHSLWAARLVPFLPV